MPIVPFRPVGHGVSVSPCPLRLCQYAQSIPEGSEIVYGAGDTMTKALAMAT